MYQCEEKKISSLFFDADDEYIIIIAQTRAYTKNHLSKEERIIVA